MRFLGKREKNPERLHGGLKLLAASRSVSKTLSKAGEEEMHCEGLKATPRNSGIATELRSF